MYEINVNIQILDEERYEIILEELQNLQKKWKGTYTFSIQTERIDD